MNAPYLLLLTFLAAGFAQAEENRWSNARGDGSGKWEVGANWSLDVPPNSGQDVVIAAARSGTVTIDATTGGRADNMFALSLRVGRQGNVLVGTDTLSLLNAGLIQPLTVLGSTVISNRGILRITGSAFNANGGLALNGGTVTLNSNSVLNVKGNNYPAYDFVVDGSVTLNGGLLTISNDNSSVLAIGNLGRGSMNILAGELRVGGAAFLDVGGQTGSVGTLTIAGGTARIEGLGFLVGTAGSTGSVVVAGGELITANAFVGGRGVGQLTVSNGFWRANPSSSVGTGPGGMLTLAGGTSVVSSGALRVGNDLTNSAESSLLMTGGTLITTNAFVRIASFAGISNGVWRASDVSVAGGLLDATNTGRMVFAGGVTTISSNLFIGSCGFFNTTGVVTVAGGELILTNAATNATLRVGNGVFRIEGGTVIVDTIELTSPCARFERSGGTLIYRAALLDPSRDDDGDGASNALEQSNGLDPLDPASPDSDGDGASDVEELLSGTDRFNSNSVFKIISILSQGTDVRLRWKTVGGKTNIIQAAEGLGGGNIVEDLATIVIPGTGDRTNTFIEAEGAIKGPARFYRLKVIP